MIWLSWRQFRLQAASAAVILAAFAILLAVTGPPLAHLFASSAVGSCQGGPDVCGGHADDFLQQLYQSESSPIGAGTYWLLYLFGIVIILGAPAVIGIFWGAPLIAGELEAGTQYLAWTQSITRTKWLAVKLTLIGLAAIAVTEAMSLIHNWWATPIVMAVDRGACCNPMAMNQFSPLVFATHGITPIGYAAFAFVLGVTVGVLARRAILAMAITLAIFAALQIAMALWVRPHLIPPDITITTLSSWGSVDGAFQENGDFTLVPDGFIQTEAWVLATQAVNTAGEPASVLPSVCLQGLQASGGGKAGHAALLDCMDSHGIRIAVTYQPASRYWVFQGTETAIYLALALAMVGYCVWRIRIGIS